MMLKMKLVCESLNEFERGMDPKSAMGTGLTPSERIKYKQKVPVLKRTEHYLGKNDLNNDVYSRGVFLWPLLDYIQKGEDSGGRRYKDLVKFYYKNPQRTLGQGVFHSLARYTIWVKDTQGFRHRPNNRYFLNKDGRNFLEKYRSAFEQK